MKKHLGLIIGLCAAVLGFVAAFMIFAPALSVSEAGYSEVVKGSEIAFGGYNDLFKASAYMLPFLLCLVGVVFAVLAAIGKLGKIAPIIAAVCFIAGGIFFFLPIDFCAFKGVEDASAEAIKSMKDWLKELFDLGAGAIVGGLFGILAGCASVATIFVAKKAK